MTPALALGDIAAITRRNLLHIVRTPQLLAFASLQPVIFVLLFHYVFGGAISVRGGSYVGYLIPGIFVQTTLFGGTATAVGLAQDLREGIIDRSGRCRWLARPCSPAALWPTWPATR